MERVLLARMLESHKVLRHDIMNCFQVILGYLQIKQPEKARKCALNTAEAMQGFGQLSNINQPLLQAFLTCWNTQIYLKQDGFAVAIEDDWQPWDDCDPELTIYLNELLQPLMEDILCEHLVCKILLSREIIVSVALKLQNNKEASEGTLTKKTEYIHKISLTTGKFVVSVTREVSENVKIIIRKTKNPQQSGRL